MLLLSSCASNNGLEKEAPFVFGEVYTQKWVAEDNLLEQGYNVVIPIVTLNKEQAILQNLYHKGKVIPLKIKLKEIGVVAVAKFPVDKEGVMKEVKADVSSKVKPHLEGLSENEIVISYLADEKIKYYKVSNIRHNPLKSYPTSVLAEFD